MHITFNKISHFTTLDFFSCLFL